MVDFQSRDTRRDLDDDDPDDSESPDHDDHHDHDSNDHDDSPDHGEDHDHADHHHHDVSDLAVAIITVSSSRSLDSDPAGDAIAEIVEDAGHQVVNRELVGDDYDRVQGVVDNVVTREDVNVVVTTGGTGVTPDDVTIEAVEPLFEKRLPGFGELFRRLSFEEIGTRAVATRAAAGVADGVPVFCLPGSENAVRLGVEEIILDVAGHLAGLARRGK